MVAVTILVSSCGGGGDDRSRNVETIAGTACAKRGATKVVSKLNYVCGTASTGMLWFAVDGKLPTKGAKSCKPLGKFDTARTRVCGSVKKKGVWVKVASLPSAVAAPTIPTTTVATVESSQAPVTTVPSANVNEPATKGLDEVAKALAPDPLPTTQEEFVAQLVPRPVEAQAVGRVPTSISVEGGSSTVANGVGIAADAEPFTVTVRDQDGNPLTAEGNTVVATISRPDVELTGAVAVTDGNGIARFEKLRVDGVAGAATITFTADFGATAEYPLSVTAGAAAAIRLSNHETQIIPLRALSTDPTATLVDKDDNIVERAGVQITALLNDKIYVNIYGGEAIVAQAVTNSKGVATFKNFTVSDKLRDQVKLTTMIEYVASDSTILPAAVEVDLVPGAPTNLEIVTQPATTVRSGFALGAQPSVRLVDTYGNSVGVSGAKVTAYIRCRADENPCGFNGTSMVTTNASGIATFTDLGISAIAGETTIAFSAQIDNAYTPLVVSEPIAVTAGLATSIRVERSTTVFTYGATVDSAFELAAIDEWGNVVDDFNGALVVSAAAPSGKPEFGYATPAMFNAGRLEVKNVVLEGKAGTYGLTFRSGSISSSQQTATLLAGSPKTFLIMSKPGTISADASLATPLAVQLLDGGDNRVQVPNYQVKLVASVMNSFTETVGTTTNGIATFSLTRFPKAGRTTVQYVDPANVIKVASDVVTVVAGSPKTIVYVQEIGGTKRSGVAFGQQPIVQVVDAQANNVLQSGITVTARVSLGCASGPKLANSTAATDSTGRASFAGLALTGTACSYSLTFTPQDGTAGPASWVDLQPGLPSVLKIVTQPTGAVNRKALTTQPVVQLLDSAGNAVPQDDIGVTATLDGASTTAKTTSNGTATFSGVTATGVVGERTVRFSVSDWPAASAVTSAKFTLTAGDVANIVPASASVSITQGGAIPSVVAKDVDGNTTTLDRSVIVSASSTGGLAWLLGSTVSVWRNGVADFTGTTVWSTDRAARLTYQLSGRTMQTTAQVNFTRSIQVGASDLGPAGGIIIDDLNDDPATPGFRATPVSGVSAGGRYVEAAPVGWGGTTIDSTMQWGIRPTDKSLQLLLSTGEAGNNYTRYRNWLPLWYKTGPQTETSAIERLANVVVANHDDWLLPTPADMTAMLEVATKDNSKLGLTFTNGNASYWSSFYDVGSYQPGAYAVEIWAGDSYEGVEWSPRNQNSLRSVRPIRYFG